MRRQSRHTVVLQASPLTRCRAPNDGVGRPSVARLSKRIICARFNMSLGCIQHRLQRRRTGDTQKFCCLSQRFLGLRTTTGKRLRGGDDDGRVTFGETIGATSRHLPCFNCGCQRQRQTAGTVPRIGQVCEQSRLEFEAGLAATS